MAPTGVRRPRTVRFRLANGLRVVLAPLRGAPTVSVWVWYRVGSKNEHPGITGASHWVEHMLFEGSPRYPKGAIDRAVISVGGELNAFTDTDFTAYFSTVPREHLGVPLDIERDRMTRALLTDREVERERTVIFSEREGNENWPEFRVEEEVYQLAFRHHPYRWDALGRREDIERLTPAELRDYYRRFYGPRNAVLVVAGGFDAAPLERRIRKAFGRLPATGADVRGTDEEPRAQGERRAELSGPGTTPYVQMAWPAPATRHADAPAVMLVDTLLGGESRLFSAGGAWGRAGEHPSARLYRALVDTGLAVRATSEYRPRVDPGLFSILGQASAGARPDRLERAVDRVIRRFVREGPTDAELSDARARIRRGAALAYEGASRTAFRLGYFSVHGSLADEERIYRALLRTTRREVRAAAARLFRPEGRVVVRYRPTGGAP